MNTNLIYPQNLEKNYNSYILLIGQQWGTKYKKNKTSKSQTLNDYISIALPLPTNGLIDTTSHTWDSTEGALLDISKEGLKQRAIKGTLEQIKQMTGNMMVAQQFKTGKTINDFSSMIYGGQSFRQFDFEFEFLPNNVKDSENLKKIIKALKYGSLPKKKGSIIDYPFSWDIKILKSNSDEYFHINKSVISNLSINRFQDNTNIHYDGEPIQTNISISFSELYKEWTK